jgi:hypothetical protein
VSQGIEATPGVAAAWGRVQSILAMTGASAAQPTASTATLPTSSATGTGDGSFASALATAQGAGTQTATAVASSGPVTLNGDDAALARSLDDWMRRRSPSSPLVGQGATFVREGRANGIDPRLLVSIATAESGLGTGGNSAAIHNAFGWGPGIRFASWEDNIATVARGLSTGYLAKGRDTIPAIQSVWAPVGASNDPGNLNSNWLRVVTSVYGELGGDPGGSVRLAG